jgi:hypothetical protein
MRKLLPLLLVAIFACDFTLDSAAADCLESEESACCVCLCQTHFVDPGVTHATPVSHAEERFSVFDLSLAQHLSDKSLFHPPKSLA